MSMLGWRSALCFYWILSNGVDVFFSNHIMNTFIVYMLCSEIYVGPDKIRYISIINLNFLNGSVVFKVFPDPIRFVLRLRYRSHLCFDQRWFVWPTCRFIITLVVSINGTDKTVWILSMIGYWAFLSGLLILIRYIITFHNLHRNKRSYHWV